MASRSSSGMKNGPRAPAARRTSGRGAYPSSSSLGAGCCMCPQRGPCGCAVEACMPTPTAQPWLGAGSIWAQGRWRRPHHGTGRTRTHHGVRHIRSVVQSVGSRWCARPFSPALESHRQPKRGAAGGMRGRTDVADRRRTQRGFVRPAAGRKGALGCPRAHYACPAPCRWGYRPPPEHAIGSSRGRDPRGKAASKLHSAIGCLTALGGRAVQPGADATAAGSGVPLSS
jgi:hypothetical protein